MIKKSVAKQDIHIAIGFDKNYMLFIYPMLASIFHNNKGEKLVFHAIPQDLSNDSKLELVKYINENHCDIVFHELNADMLSRKLVYPKGTHFNIATYYRLFFPFFVYPYSNRLLYLDADLVVLGNLRELYEKNIGNHPIAAVADPFIGKCERLNILDDEGYFNAGVMVIDLVNWHAQQISEKAIKFVEDYPEKIKFCDQDALNVVLARNWISLGNKYNFTQFAVKLQVPVKELVDGVLIVHYTSSNKPWNALSRNKLRYLYQKYLSLSPRRGAGNYIDLEWNFKFLKNFLRIRIKEFYFNHRLDKVVRIKNWEIPSWDY